MGVLEHLAEHMAGMREARDLMYTMSSRRAVPELASQFIANMSHELRTPLNAIIGITEMLREDVIEDGQVGYEEPLGRVSRAGKHLLNLINDVLDYSKIEAEKVVVEPITCSPHTMIRL